MILHIIMEIKDISVEELKLEIKKEVVQVIKNYVDGKFRDIEKYIEKQKKYYGMTFLQ